MMLTIQSSTAQVRTSANYQLQSDSVNLGGGYSSSTNFQQESTFGEIATGGSDSSTYRLRAGYQQMQEVYLSLVPPSDVELSPSLPGITGGASNGSTSVTVTTDSPSGYLMTIQSEGAPAMQSGVNSILDLSTTTRRLFDGSAGEARFGYSVFSDDAVQSFNSPGFGNGCGLGINTVLECWRGLTTTPFTIATGSGSNHPSGTNTTLFFRVVVGSGAGVPAGVYTATTTLTALPL